MRKPNWKAEVLLAGSWRGATSVLLSRDDYHIVVDTGLPHEAHQLQTALARRGIRPGDVQAIINTHYHIDHVLNNCLFPSAAIYGPQQSFEWCRAAYESLREPDWKQRALEYYPETYDYPDADANMAALRKFALRWWDVHRLGSPSQFRWTESVSLPEGLETVVTHGHVPGHISIIVDGPTRIVVAGDALMTRDHDHRVLTMIPHNRQQAQRDRALILSLGGRIIPGHDDEFFNPSPDATEAGFAASLSGEMQLDAKKQG